MTRGVCITVDFEREFFGDDSVFHQKAALILALFSAYEIRATFFVCGDAIARDKELIQRIAEKHEIAAHGFHHQNLRRLSRQELGNEVRRTRKAFANAHIACIGFRCPYLIVPRSLGSILKENGFIYDSSLLRSPFSLHRLFYPFSRTIVEEVKEIPIQVVTPLKIPFNLSSLRLMGVKHLPRLLPELPQMFYFHPWELAEMRDLRGHSLRRRMLVNTGKKAVAILEALLGLCKHRGMEFLTCREWLQDKAAESKAYEDHTG